jgi:hypothetical protein
MPHEQLRPARIRVRAEVDLQGRVRAAGADGEVLLHLEGVAGADKLRSASRIAAASSFGSRVSLRRIPNIEMNIDTFAK